MQSILVTGGCGFIGANFIRYVFERTDFQGIIVNIDKLTYAGNPLSVADIACKYNDRYKFYQLDILDKSAVEEVVTKHGVTHICHFAAESHVDRSIASPLDFVSTNVLGTFNLLEIARSSKNDVGHFHHVSTDEVFGSLGNEGFFTELTPYRPNSPYSASKAASDHFVRAYSKTYSLPVTVSNCSNNYGPFQFPEKLIPLVILNALAEKTLPVYGDGLHVRDWLYVEDHCEAIWLIITKGQLGETYNIGGMNEMPNIEVVKLICDTLDQLRPLSHSAKRTDLISHVRDRPGHDRRYAIDCTKIREGLDWHPRQTFLSGIQATVEWYLSNSQWLESVRSGEYRNWITSHYGMQAEGNRGVPN